MPSPSSSSSSSLLAAAMGDCGAAGDVNSNVLVARSTGDAQLDKAVWQWLSWDKVGERRPSPGVPSFRPRFPRNAALAPAGVPEPSLSGDGGMDGAVLVAGAPCSPVQGWMEPSWPLPHLLPPSWRERGVDGWMSSSLKCSVSLFSSAA